MYLVSHPHTTCWHIREPVHSLCGMHTALKFGKSLHEVVTGTSTSEGLTEASPMVSLNGFSAQQRSTPDRVRQAISNAQRKRYKDNPELRAQVSAKLKGRPAWNKGRTMSEETRKKMSLAKLNRSVSKDVRKKMSAAHKGKTHTAQTSALLSEKLSGRPKSAEHRMAIAAAQRRRHAAARVLKAVEDVHRHAQAEGNPLGTPKLPTSPTKLAKRGRPLKATTSGMRSTTSTPTSSKTQLLEAYKMQLREYKALLEELGPWVRAFEQQSGRKPKLHDVEATRIPWLLEKYKKYVVLRERVMLDTTGLRGMLGGGQAPNNTVARMETSGAAQLAASSAGPLKNKADAAAARFAAAMAYKAARTEQDIEDEHTDNQQQQQNHPSSTVFGNTSSNAVPFTPTDPATAMPSATPTTTNSVPHDAPPRVKAAMAAAMEYRKKKATATAAAANAAAVAAQLSPGSPRNASQVAPRLSSSNEGPLQEVLAAQQAAQQAVEEAQHAERSVREALQQMTGESRVGSEKLPAAV